MVLEGCKRSSEHIYDFKSTRGLTIQGINDPSPVTMLGSFPPRLGEGAAERPLFAHRSLRTLVGVAGRKELCIRFGRWIVCSIADVGSTCRRKTGQGGPAYGTRNRRSTPAATRGGSLVRILSGGSASCRSSL